MIKLNIKGTLKGAQIKTNVMGIQEVREILIELLDSWGLPEEYGKNYLKVGDDKDNILLQPNCSNSEFTRALGMLQLVFGENVITATPPGCVAYNRSSMRIHERTGYTWDDIYKYLTGGYVIDISIVKKESYDVSIFKKRSEEWKI